MNDKIEISRELIERTLPCIYKSEKRGAKVAKELRQALDGLTMKREGQAAGAGDVLRSMTKEDFESVAANATIAQQVHLIAHYKKIIDRYQHLCGELYQVLGALDAPGYVLDRVLDASDSVLVTNTPSLLPFDKHAWPASVAHSCGLDTKAKCGACLDKAKELNQ
jgi:hypothetical protein